jgi:Phage portal protein, SPP1 Gp6-like
MPSALQYVPPTDPERNGFGSEVAYERQQRRNAYHTALMYYVGDHPEQIPYDPASDDYNSNAVVNLVQMTADRTVGFLFPAVPGFELDPKSQDDTPEEAWLKEVFDANGGLAFFTKLGLRGFLAGHAFIRVQQVPENRRGVPDQFPKISVLDPTSVSVYWKADDVGEVLWYEQRYMVGVDAYVQDYVHDPEQDRWLIYTYKQTHSVDNVHPVVAVTTAHGRPKTITALDTLDFAGASGYTFEQVGPPVIHTGDVPPIIEVAHLPHPDDYYGMGEFTQQTLQDTINRIMSLRNRIIAETADPVDVFLGTDIQDVQKSRGIFSVANPAADVKRLEMKSDLTAVTATLDKLIETYLAVARVVLLKGEAKDLQRVTNASVRTLFLDALSKNATLQASYGLALKKLVRLLLRMGVELKQVPATVPEAAKIVIRFPEPLPMDATEIANQAAIMVNMGAMSKRTAATTMGLDWSFETEAMGVEEAQALARQEAQLELQARTAPKPEPDQPSDNTQEGA